MSPRVRKVKVVAEQDPARGEVSFDEIAALAYEIHISGAGGDEFENWLRAEAQLKAELAPEIQGEEELHVAA